MPSKPSLGAEECNCPYTNQLASRPAEYTRPPFLLSLNDVVEELQTNLDTGLVPEQAAHLLTKYGENRLQDHAGVLWYKVFLKQVFNAMILVLILAMALSYGVTDWIEGGVITAVIALNVGVGFYQEYRAEQTVDALRSLSSPTAAVVRDGNLVHIPSIHVVPGDIVDLNTGDVIPADCRLFDVMNFEADEALLTGESLPVAKDSSATFADESTGVGDRINMAYSSSTVTKGRGRGIVVHTGMSTEIGKIAESLKKIRRRKQNRSMSPNDGIFQPVKGATLRAWDVVGKALGLTLGTPLQVKLAKLAYILLLLAVLLALIVFAVNKFNVSHEVATYAIEKASADIMRIPPHDNKKGVFTWEILVDMMIHDTEHKFPFFKDMWDNQFLFWAVVLGTISVIPVIHIPVLNTNVFRHKGITWEWALAFGGVVAYVLGTEAWKLPKKHFGLFNEGLRDRGVPIKQGRFSLPWTLSKGSIGGSTVSKTKAFMSEKRGEREVEIA
ncbi:hypothetical protein EW146_g9023 [Bondarzewia mesenterica]|uniref:Cation-transporting P-type ATPase N-terminal domain-containing protein n=1 Tax=Bondarzewia mesenterica TaxID=1095465 RepID=A0A4S4LF49_9AGAM|nr:hypothetical protein EW146_g9023 [Bondarzewia mesenterica]